MGYQRRVHGGVFFQYSNVLSQGISFLTFGSLVKNCNHKRLGIYYLLSAFIFGISGTLISVLIRIELYSSGNRIISPENQNFYNVSITLHGLLMIFFLVMPGLFAGFGNYFAPVFQGSPQVVYPRVNNLSILVLFLSYLLVILSLFSFILTWTFISLRIKEFRVMGLLINDSVYGSVFFFITGLHFFHLVVGLFLLSLFFWGCSFSLKKWFSSSLRISELHLFYNLQIFYWHFIEILWLFIFSFLYFYFFFFFFFFFFLLRLAQKIRKTN